MQVMNYILGVIGNSCLSVPQITLWFVSIHCIGSQVQIWNK